MLKAAGQPVPESLLKFGTTVKKKEHSAYGAFYRETEGQASVYYVPGDGNANLLIECKLPKRSNSMINDPSIFRCAVSTAVLRVACVRYKELKFR